MIRYFFNLNLTALLYRVSFFGIINHVRLERRYFIGAPNFEKRCPPLLSSLNHTSSEELTLAKYENVYSFIGRSKTDPV